MSPVRTFGGAGGATTSTAVITAANVVWGPNFGSTRQFAEEGHVAALYTAASTQLLLEEELVRLTLLNARYPMTSDEVLTLLAPAVGLTVLAAEEELLRLAQQQASYPVTAEELIRLFQQQASFRLSQEGLTTVSASAINVRSVIEEAHAAVTQFQSQYRPLVEEGTFASVSNSLAILKPASTAEELIRLLNLTPTYGFGQGELGVLKSLQYTNVRPVSEEVLSGSVGVVFSSSTSWTVPTGVTAITGIVFAGGGGGGNGAVVNGGGGGGGGGVTITTGIPATAGTTMTITVGLGGATTAPGQDSWAKSSSTCLSRGGSPGVSASGAGAGGAGGAGGSTATAIGTLKFKGGIGGTAGGQGGSGGGGAGTLNNGGDSPGTTVGGAGGTLNGGNGGNGGNAGGGAGVVGNPNGGGGGGGGSVNGVGAAGARGQVQIFYALP